MSRYFPLMAFTLVCILLGVGLSIDTRAVTSPLIGKSAPHFSLPDLLQPEKKVAMSDFAGHVVVLNVWASWCTTCSQEHPVLVELAKQSNALIVGLNYKDSRDNAIAWLKNEGNPYARIVYDGKGDTSIDYGVRKVPETFVIDRLGVIRLKHTGAITYVDLKNKFLPLISRLSKN